MRKPTRLTKIICSCLILYIVMVNISLYSSHHNRDLRGSIEEEPFDDYTTAQHELKLKFTKSAFNSSIIYKFNNLVDYNERKKNRTKSPFAHVDNNKLTKLRREDKDGACPSLVPSIKHALVNQWVTLNKETPESHAYSAFFDRREKTVKIMAISNGYLRGFYCHLWLHRKGENVSLHVVKSKQYIVQEDHGLRFAPYIIFCDLPQEWKKRPPSYVSVVRDKCTETDVILPVQNRFLKPLKPKYNFTVCLTPINRGYSNVGEFLQFMEVNSMFGANHFVFYDHQIGDSLLPFIKSYKAEGKLDVLDWKVPVETTQGPTNQIHYFGQVVALNDCLYRSRTNAKYVAFIDLDEIITPMKQSNWLDVINEIPNTENYSSYIFNCVFFREEWKANPRYSNIPLVAKFKFRTLRYTKRERKALEPYIRSKYIADPNKINVVGIHFAWKSVLGFRDYIMPEKEGLLFHYRNWETFPETDFSEETRIFNFTDTILDRIQKRIILAESFGFVG